MISKKHIARHTFNMTRRAIGYGLLGAFLALAGVAVYVLQKRPDLDLWQEVYLDEEFTRDSGVADFESYLELEQRLFDQLEAQVYQKTPAGDADSINRYAKGSLSDPSSQATNWNRTFQLKQENPTAGILLLHGMSDSPYSLSHIGRSLHDGGATVIGLRLPGHGTAPSGLVRTTWRDMAAAVRLAVVHLKKSVGDRPVFLMGYSNGGALSVEYALESLADPALPAVDGLVLVSPAIGITPAAAVAVWQGRVGRWLGLNKLAWNSISLEYDPFKYGSFAVNAGDQAYRISLEIDKSLATLSKAGKLGNFPRVLAFQSAVDATVSAPDLVSKLFDKLPDRGHELILYDINREVRISHILKKDPAADLAKLLARANAPFTVSVVTNRVDASGPTKDVIIRRSRVGSEEFEVIDPGMRWPGGMYSLSHIALPFPKSDPLYGVGEGGKRLTLGNLTLRGERGSIRISAADMLRQRWNPFYPFFEQRVREFCGEVPSEQ